MEKSFKARLKALRGSKSQAEAAKLVGIYQQKWQRLEHGDTEPDIKLILDLCEKFACSSDYLLGLSETKDTKNESVLQQKLNIAKNAFSKLTDVVKELEGAL